MSVLEFIKVVILGIVEGITEWLPISSTGHMLLVDEFIQIQASKEFKEMFLLSSSLAQFWQLSCCSGKKCGHFR